MILYFDTETTGLCPGRIVQLSYIMEYADKTVGKNFYFYVDYVEPSAIAVHGYTPDKLDILSSGKTFSDFADEIFDDFFAADLLVAHNFKFDLSFMIAEFSYLSSQFRYKDSFDSMKYFTSVLKLQRPGKVAYKYPKLSELCDFYDVYSYDVSRGVKNFFGDYSTNAHEARFDTTAMFLSINCARNSISELGEYFANNL